MPDPTKLPRRFPAALDRRGNGPLFHRARRQQVSARHLQLLARPNKTGRPTRPPLVVKVGTAGATGCRLRKRHNSTVGAAWIYSDGYIANVRPADRRQHRQAARAARQAAELKRPGVPKAPGRSAVTVGIEALPNCCRTNASAVSRTPAHSSAPAVTNRRRGTRGTPSRARTAISTP
jgi:hypothetical protein